MPPSDSSGSSASAPSDGRTALRVALVAFLFFGFFFHGHFFGTDELAVYEGTRSLYLRGDLAVPKGPHRFTGRQGEIYSHFAVGQSVLALPFYALGDLAARTLPEGARRALSGRPAEGGRIDSLGRPEVFFVAWYAPIASALLVALFFLFERRLGVSRESAVLAAAVLAAGTYVATQSVYFLRHTSETLTLMGAFLALLLWRQTGRRAALAVASALAGATLLVRVPAAVGLPALMVFGAWLLRRHVAQHGHRGLPSLALAALGPALLACAVHAGLNWLRWGTLLQSPMTNQASLFGTPLHVGLMGLLFSPGCSLFLYSPPLLLLPVTLPHLWRRNRAVCGTALLLVLSFLFFCARFDAWSGLWSSPGPRYLFVATPLLMLPLGLWLDAGPGRGGRLALAGLTALGAGVQIVLASTRWSGVIRSEGYMQDGNLDFLFEAARSPILGSARRFLAGDLDVFWWGLAHGWPPLSGRPLVAATGLALWSLAFAVALWRLLRTLGHTPPAPGRQPGGSFDGG